MDAEKTPLPNNTDECLRLIKDVWVSTRFQMLNASSIIREYTGQDTVDQINDLIKQNADAFVKYNICKVWFNLARLELSPSLENGARVIITESIEANPFNYSSFHGAINDQCHAKRT